MKTCKEIKQKRQEAFSKLCDEYDALMTEAVPREFPIGTKVKYMHGTRAIIGTVVGHGRYSFGRDEVEFKNDSSGTKWIVKAFELAVL